MIAYGKNLDGALLTGRKLPGYEPGNPGGEDFGGAGTLVAAPTLLLKSGMGAGREYQIDPIARIGRHPYNEVSVSDPAVSRYHCWITATAQGFFVEDLASSNGTYLNGRRITSRKLLHAGDEVRVGGTRVVFNDAT